MSDVHQKVIGIGKSKEKGVSFENQPLTDDDVRALCNCKTLVNVGLESTNITDKALEYLASLPKLKLLWLGNTKITGSGFVHFANHPKLDCLGVEKRMSMIRRSKSSLTYPKSAPCTSMAQKSLLMGCWR